MPFDANDITFFWLGIGVLGGVCFLSSAALPQIVGAVLLHVSFALDITDGDIARLRKQKSVRGRMLDRATHRLVAMSLLFSLTLSSYLANHDIRRVFIGFLGMAFFELSNTLPYFIVKGTYVNNVYTESSLAGTTEGAVGTPLAGLKSVRYLYTDPGLLLMAALAAIARQAALLPVFYGFSAPVFFLYRFVRLWKRLQS